MTITKGQYRLPPDIGDFSDRHQRMLALAGFELSETADAPFLAFGTEANQNNADTLHVCEPGFQFLLPQSRATGPLGLMVDAKGACNDATRRTELERHLSEALLDDRAALDNATQLAERLAFAGLYGSNTAAPLVEVPEAPYTIVIAERTTGADILREMLVFAQTEHPGMPVQIWNDSSETALPDIELGPRVSFVSPGTNYWTLLGGAAGVYAYTSFAGFLAIYAGHKPRVFGSPFYAGWGLTADETDLPHRSRKLTRVQLFLGAMVEFPIWYDPFNDCQTDLGNVIDILEAENQVLLADTDHQVAIGMSAWKRPHIQRFFGQVGPLRFVKTATDTKAKTLVWGMTRPEEKQVIRVEDGFLRSKGLGASFVAPLSLVADDLGMYYNAASPSRLEQLIEASPALPPHALARAARLRRRILDLRLTKYNLAQETALDLPRDKRLILVPGQVEDDASIEYGCDTVSTNLGLLERTRSENQDAFIVFKPHPDVASGRRAGKVAQAQASELADVILTNVSVPELLDIVDDVWTMTSTMGFEALMRGKKVTCLGLPFYAGWGLTRDLGLATLRRKARPTLDQLIHAVLIGYPRYLDPKTGMVCPPEVIIDRLADPDFKQVPMSWLGRMLQRFAF
jgi:capsular polysaccharide export protein